jgi:DNA-binding MarR family transcriptional regulator
MLKQSLTYSLASIAEEGIGNANRLFEQRFGWDIRELRVLRLVRETPGITFTALARLTRFERSATSRILTRMIKAGLIARTAVEHDGRQFTFAITETGEALCEQADPLSLELEALMLAPLTAEQRETLIATMGTVMDWVSGGYRATIEARFPEVGTPRPRRGAGGENV